MRCPYCGYLNDRVVDSRETREGDSIRRRRECLKCSHRFTSYERIDEIPFMVVKKNGQRERFQRGKILGGLLRACEKRSISPTQLEDLADSVEQAITDSRKREITSREIGEMLMNELKQLDKVAYIRFASVYLDFKNVDEFIDEINELVKSGK